MNNPIDKENWTFLEARKSWLIPLSIASMILTGTTVIYTLNNNPQKSLETAPPVVEVPEIKAVTALGRIEPQGEMIQLAPPPDLGGTRISQLLVEEGDRVTEGQIIAILDNHDRTKSAVELARQDIKVAEANLAIVKAGAKQGEINAQKATINRLKAQLRGEISANQAQISRLEAQLKTETVEKQATIDRLKAELKNAQSEYQRYEKLAQEGVISDSELDSRSLSVDTAQERLLEAKARYNRTGATLQEEIREAKAVSQQEIDTLQEQIIEAEATLDRIAEVRDVNVLQAQAEVDRAVAALKQAEEDLKLTYVKAPSDGQIIAINAYPGEAVGEDGVAEFGRTNQMIVVAEVYESDISKVNIGQQATITSETGAFEGKITGKVSHIGLKIGKQDVLDTDPAADVDSRVVEVKIRLDPESSDRVSYLTNSKAIVRIES